MVGHGEAEQGPAGRIGWVQVANADHCAAAVELDKVVVAAVDGQQVTGSGQGQPERPVQRRAGFACVYNVPLGAALFATEVLVGAVNRPVVLPALGCAGVATLTGWIYLPHHAIYLGIPQYAFAPGLLVYAVLLGPVVGVIAAGYLRLIGVVSHYGQAWPSAPGAGTPVGRHAG